MKKIIYDDESDCSSEEGYHQPKWAQPSNSDNDSDSCNDVIDGAEDILEAITKKKVVKEDKASAPDMQSLNSDEDCGLLDLDEELVSSDEWDMDDETKELCAVADEAIFECCTKVAITALSANAALLLPGISQTIGCKAL